MGLTTKVDSKYHAGWFGTTYWNSTGVEIIVTNDGEDEQILEALNLQLVSGNISGATITDGTIGNGKSIKVAIFKEGTQISDFVTVKESPNNNFVQYADSSHTTLSHLTSGSYANNACFFVPRLKETGSDVWSGLPSGELDSVKKTTYEFKIKEPFVINKGVSVTLLLSSNGTAEVNTILQVGYIRPDSAVPKSNTVWLRVNGEWKKVLNVRKYDKPKNEWVELPGYKKNSSGWSDS